MRIRLLLGKMFCLALAAAAFTFLPAPAPVFAAATKQDVAAAKKEKEVLEAQRRKTLDAIARLEGLRADTEAYIYELDLQLTELQDEIDGLAEDIVLKEEDIEETTGELLDAEETERQQYEAMKLRIRYMYETGDTTLLDIFMHADSMADLLNKTEYVAQISHYDRDMLEKYIAIKEQIAATKARLETEKAELEELKAETEAKEESVELLMAEKNKELAGLNSQINQKSVEEARQEQEIEAKQEQIEQLEEEIRKAEEEARRRAEEEARRKAAEEARRKAEEEARKKAEAEAAAAQQKAASSSSSASTVKAASSGSFIWPCPASRQITSRFGSRTAPTAGASTYHQGIDIGAGSGTSIVAAAGGTVSLATYSSSAGNYVMISHGNGRSTVYMHCSKLLVKAGDTVKQGQVIAKVGSTGYSTGPHLHFGVRINGTYVNPLNYVSP